MATPTSRTLELFRKEGYEVQIVERFIGYANVRKDYLTCLDLHALKAGQKTIIGIQCFSTAWQEHYRKICVEYPEGAKFWLGCGHKFIFIGWRKLKVKRGGKAVRWTPRFGRVKLTKKGKIKLTEVEYLWQALR